MLPIKQAIHCFQVFNDGNRPDVGWYQVRKALEARNENGIAKTIDFDPINRVYKIFGDKLRPKVYEYGFLRE
jgi:hypothetical protein